MKHFFTLLLLSSIVAGKMGAQSFIPPVCQSGQPISSPTCVSACVNCDMNSGFDDQLFAFPFPDIVVNFCVDAPGQGPLVLTNARWYAFIAGSSFVEFSFKTTGCSSGNNIDVALFAYCPTSGPGNEALSCATPLDPDNPTLSFNGLSVGDVYLLVVDGANGAVCKYSVIVSQGSANPPNLGPLGTISGPTEVCPKAKVKYSVPPVTFATTYTWTAPPGSKIDGGSNIVTKYVIPGTLFTANTVEVEFGPVGGNVCVSVSSPCKDPVTTCLQVTNTAIPITVLDSEVYCYEQLPIIWSEQPYTALLTPGTYTLTSTPYQSYLGCDSVVRQEIKVLPRKFRALPVNYLCEPECFYVNGFEFCETGTYLEIVPSADGCDSTVQFSLVKIPVKAAAQVSDTLTCTKTEVLLTSTGSSQGNTVFYEWLNPSGQTISTQSTAIATVPGAHTLIVTNFGGGKACKDSVMVMVAADTTLPQANAGPDMMLSCAQAQIQLQGAGSAGPQYSYLWVASNGGNIVSGGATLTPIVNATGLYILYVTDNENGCVSFDVTKVTAQTLPPTVSAQGGSQTCVQPSVTLQATTNATNPTFLWNGPGGFTSNLQNPTVNTPGNYTIIVTDGATGCSNSAVAIVVDDAQLPGASAIGDTLTCTDTDVVISGSSPASNPTYSWSGPNGFASTLQNPTVGLPGNYILTVTGSNGCTSTATAVVSQNIASPGATLSVTGNLNCNNANTNLVATSNPPASILNFTWTNPDGSTTNTGNNPALNVNQPGAYSVMVTNTINGCTSTATAMVIQNPNVTASAAGNNVLCNGAQNGSATATPGGGNNTYTYLWNTGANTPTINNLGAGTYTVTVTDGENCTATATVTVTQPTLLLANASATPQTGNGTIDGTATATPTGGTPTYSFNWNTGGTTATITNLLPGNYSVTVTDINGCTAVAVVTVNAFNCTIAATVQSQNVSCAGTNDGSATITVTNGVAPFTYSWSNGGETSTIENLAPGSYSGTATDAANCPTEVLVLITEPAPLLANASSTNATGPGINDGTATAGSTGGTQPYSYLWTTGETTASIANLAPGTYGVTVSDANGCTATGAVEVIASECGLSSAFLAVNPSCNGLTNGQITVLITGGNGPFTYLWSSGGTAQTESNLGEGTYTVSVTDAEGCQIMSSVALTQPPLLTIVTESITNTDCAGLPEGSATISAEGGTGTISIVWSNGQTGPTAINLVAGSFGATATDANGCAATTSVIVNAVDTESPVIVGGPVDVALGSTGTVTLTAQLLGVTATDNCAVSSITIAPTNFNCTQLGPQSVTVTATDDSGNTSTAIVVVTIIDNSPPTTSCPPSIVRCFGDNVVQYGAPVATDNCLGNGGFWTLSAGLPSGATFPLGVTTNTYTYTDAGGNAGSCSFEVTILNQIVVNADVTDDFNNQNVGAINLTVTGGLPPFTYVWTKNGQPFPANTEDLTNLGAGEYVVVVTDAFGCTIQSQTFEVRNTVDAKEPNWASELLIRPNPTSGHISIIFPDGVNDEVQLTVLDMTGRRVIQQIVTAPKQLDWDLSNLPSGVYPILLRVKDEMLARRIVVSK